MGAPPSRLWPLEVGVVGVMISEVLRLPVLDASATPDGCKSEDKDMIARSYHQVFTFLKDSKFPLKYSRKKPENVDVNTKSIKIQYKYKEIFFLSCFQRSVWIRLI